MNISLDPESLRQLGASIEAARGSLSKLRERGCFVEEEFKILPVEEIGFWEEMGEGVKNVVLALLRSRKVWVAAGALAQTVAAHYLQLPAEVWVAIDALAVALIGSIAWEDVAKN